MTSTGYSAPSAAADARRRDRGDRVGDQLDGVALQRRQPRAVVLQHALAEGRVAGRHLRQQLRVVADLLRDPVGEVEPHHLVHGVHRALGMRPLRIDLDRLQDAVRRRPEDHEAVPLRVVRHVLQQPLLLVAHARVVARVRRHPGRLALEDEEPRRLLRHLGHELEGAGAGADHRHALAVERRRRAARRRSGTPARRTCRGRGCRAASGGSAGRPR